MPTWIARIIVPCLARITYAWVLLARKKGLDGVSVDSLKQYAISRHAYKAYVLPSRLVPYRWYYLYFPGGGGSWKHFTPWEPPSWSAVAND